MAASNLEIRISRLVDMIATKFQGLPHIFWGKVSNGTIGNTVRRNRKSEIQDGSLQSGNTYISTLLLLQLHVHPNAGIYRMFPLCCCSFFIRLH